MLAGDVLSLSDDGSVHRRHVGEVAAAIRPRSRGGAVIAVQRGFVLEHADGTLEQLPELWADPQIRMNEGGCDPHGRFYCGSMAYDKSPGRAALYRLDTDCSTRVVLNNVTISNGIEWSPDGSRAYYSDTATYRIDIFDYDRESGLTRRRAFVDLAAEQARPDGLTVDAEGGVWVALSNRSAVRRYRADGVLDCVVELPVQKVTACTFGGPRLDQLFITTSQDGIPKGSDKLAGSLFRVFVGQVGVAVREFGG
jgi:sugar lactone lactonase YvrE